jgi:hypothetical protein
MITTKQAKALRAVAEVCGWNELELCEIELVAWCVFHYYVHRLHEKDDGNNCHE